MVDRKHDPRRRYIQNVLQVSVDEEETYLAVMESYGSNHWWSSDDPVKIAKYQMNESKLLVPFIQLQNALEFVLKRTVSPSEISYSNDALRSEVEVAIA